MRFVGCRWLLATFQDQKWVWAAALLLATIQLPECATPLNSVSRSLEELKNRETAPLQPSPAPLQSSDVTSGIQPEPEGPEESEEASQAEGDDPEAKPG